MEVVLSELVNANARVVVHESNVDNGEDRVGAEVQSAELQLIDFPNTLGVFTHVTLISITNKRPVPPREEGPQAPR